MSEFIELKNAKEIRQWREAHRPETGMKVESLREILEAPKTSHELDKQSEESTYYGVQHLLYTSGGEALICLQRVFLAKDAEEALQQYIFEAAERSSGRGEQYISFKLYDDFNYEPQKISVIKLAKGTNHFF